MAKRRIIPYQSSDGTLWGAEVRMPSHSSALVIFHHPSGETARLNRYAWVNAKRSEASDPGKSLDALAVLTGIDAAALGRLFGKSHPIETARPSYIAS